MRPMLLRWQTHLFIDTWPVCEQLETELSRHSVRVRRYLVMHDTVTFGETGEDGTRGLIPALRAFLVDHPEWKIVAEYANSHGLIVIRRI